MTGVLGTSPESVDSERGERPSASSRHTSTLADDRATSSSGDVAARPNTDAVDWQARSHRSITVLAAVSLSGVSFATWVAIVPVPAIGLISVFGFAAGLVLTVMAITVSPERLSRVDGCLVVLSLILLAGWAASNIYTQPGYGTDEAAFEQYAAHLMVHGHDPYGANLAPALSLYRVPIQYATYLMNGGLVHTLGYPALPVLIVAAFVPLTGGVQSVILVNVVVLALTVLVTWQLLPRPWKAMSVLVPIGLPILFGYALSGVNAIIMCLFMVVVAWRWTDTGRSGRLGRSGILRAVCLGLAIATTQLAWFIFPFILIGLWRIRRADLGRQGARHVLGRYAAIALGTFLLVNAPFIIWGPSAWLSGVTSTLTQHAIPYGQGLVDAALFFGIGGGDLSFYTIAGVAFYFAMVALYWLRFDRLGRAAFVLPVIALFFSTRPLAEYWMVLVVVWVVSALTTNASDFAAPAKRGGTLASRSPIFRMVLAVSLFIPAGIATVAALATPAPLAINVVSVRTNGELEGVWKITAAVRNRSGSTLEPHFATNFIGQASTYFFQTAGPARLQPGQSAIYTMTAPNRGSMPGITAPFILTATTSSPMTISSSRRFVPEPYSADLEPSYVNRVIAPGGSVTFTVDLRSPFGAQVDRAGVRIALDQVIYGQDGLIYSQARINGAPEGHTPVFAITGAGGIAVFHVTDPQPQPDPVYFQAWVAGSYPSGYSDIVPVTWQLPAGQ